MEQGGRLGQSLCREMMEMERTPPPRRPRQSKHCLNQENCQLGRDENEQKKGKKISFRNDRGMKNAVGKKGKEGLVLALSAAPQHVCTCVTAAPCHSPLGSVTLHLPCARSCCPTSRAGFGAVTRCPPPAAGGGLGVPKAGSAPSTPSQLAQCSQSASFPPSFLWMCTQRQRDGTRGHVCLLGIGQNRVSIHPCPLVATADTRHTYTSHTPGQGALMTLRPSIAAPRGSPVGCALALSHPRDQSSAPCCPSGARGAGRNPATPTRTNLGREGSNRPRGLSAQQTAPLTLPIARAVSNCSFVSAAPHGAVGFSVALCVTVTMLLRMLFMFVFLGASVLVLYMPSRVRWM